MDEYNKARTIYCKSCQGLPQNEILSDDEMFLVSQWWAQDDTLLSNEKDD